MDEATRAETAAAAVTPPKPARKLPFKVKRRSTSSTQMAKTEKKETGVETDNEDSGVGFFSRGKAAFKASLQEMQNSQKKKKKKRVIIKPRSSSASPDKSPEPKNEQSPEPEKIGTSPRVRITPGNRARSNDAAESMPEDAPSPAPSDASQISDRSTISWKDGKIKIRVSPSRKRQNPDEDTITPRKKAKIESLTPHGEPLITVDRESADGNAETPTRLKPEAGDSPMADNGANSDDDVFLPCGPGDSASPASNKSPDEFDEFQVYIDRAKALKIQEPTDAAIILVQMRSTVEGSQTLTAKLRLTQSIKAIYRVWRAQHQESNIPIGDDVCITWRGKCVYTNTTLYSLGIRPQYPDSEYRTGQDPLCVEGESVALRQADGFTKSFRAVDLVVWTNEAYNAFLVEQDKKRLRLLEPSGDSNNEEFAEGDATEVRVTLQSKHYGTLQLTVNETTTIETLVGKFRRAKNVEPGKYTFIKFDGETLEEHNTIGDSDIQDEDTLEVHFE